jgi:hypothetical protein
MKREIIIKCVDNYGNEVPAIGQTRKIRIPELCDTDDIEYCRNLGYNMCDMWEIVNCTHHVFTDNQDYYIDDEKEAMFVYNCLCNHNEDVRIYRLDPVGKNEDEEKEHFIAGQGNFPA